MRSVNKVILVGNLTRDPQVKTTSNGQTVTTFGLATNRNWTTAEGEQKSSTEFHELVVWSKLAEIAANTLKTGKLVYIEGYLKTRSWDQEDGTKRFKTEVVVEDLIILSKKENGSDDYTSNDNEKPESDDSTENLINDDNLF